MRRSNFEDQPTDYGAVGATQAPDLLQYPPHGFKPYEDSIKIGSGEERFHAASASLLFASGLLPLFGVQPMLLRASLA